MKFEVTSFNTFEVMPQTRFRDTQTDRVTLVYPPNFVCGGITTDRQSNKQDYFGYEIPGKHLFCSQVVRGNCSHLERLESIRNGGLKILKGNKYFQFRSLQICYKQDVFAKHECPPQKLFFRKL